MKIKFAGIFRSLLGRNGDVESVRPAAATVTAAPAPVATKPAATPAPSALASKPTYSSSYTPARPAQTAEPKSEPKSSDHIEISLVAIVNGLPMDLKAKLIETPLAGKTVSLAVEAVIGQLAFGAVKITFGELRKLAPGIFVNSNSVYDSRPISLPLNEILARINPALLSRRPAAQKFEVAEEIAGPFGGRGRGVTFTANPLKPSAATTAAPARSVTPAAPTPPPRETKPLNPTPVAPPAPAPVTPPTASVSTPRTVTPSPAPAPTPATPSEPIAFTMRQNAPLVAPIPFAEPSKPASNGHAANGNGTNNGNGNGHASPVVPALKFGAVPVPSPAVTTPSAEAQPTISIPLKELAENWPDEIKAEIVQNGLAKANVPLPLALIEPGLKRGRVMVNWKNLRALVNPSLPASPSDALDLDLPLKALAPAFLAAQKKLSPTQSKVAVSAEIPNLFFGFPQPEPPAPPAFKPSPLPQSPANGAENQVLNAQHPHSPFAPKVADTNLFSAGTNGAATPDESDLFKRTPLPATDFLTRQTQPKDVVAQAMALPGVAGAVVALADGLRVAGEVPAEFNADTFAAFLPQIYDRVNQSTRELRMGSLNNVSFTVGNVPWKIFRINSIYFAAFGRAGEALPKSKLAALAAGLDRKQK